MKHTLPRIALPLVLTAASVSTYRSFAGNGTWTSTSDSLWSNGANWSTGEAAGAVDAASLANDTATIRGAYQPNIVLDQDVFLAYLQFSQQNSAMSPYVLSSINEAALHLCKASDAITYYGTTVKDAVVTLNCPIVLHYDMGVSCNNEEPSSYLVIGGSVTSDGSGGRNFQLKGYTSITNVCSAVVSDNGSGRVSLSKSNAGTWRVSGASTYTGWTYIYEGTLIAEDDLYQDQACPFGIPNSTYGEVRVGNQFPADSTGDASLLLGLKEDGSGVICRRTIASYYNNNESSKAIYQLSHIGGANTSGTTTFAGQVVLRRSSNVFQCATGGRCVFSGTVNTRNMPLVVGWPGFGGTVDFRSSFANTTPIAVSNGTMEANCVITADVNVDGGVLAGAGSIAGAVAVGAGGALSGGTNGVGTLTVTGDATLAAGASLLLPVNESTSAPLLAVNGALSLDGAYLDVGNGDSRPARSVTVATATGGITGTPDLSRLPGACTATISATSIEISFRQPVVVLVR